MATQDHWRFVEATADERERFRDVDAVLARARDTPVAPRNRLREVRLVEAGGARYFLKTFDATPLKNRVRNRTTAPRCDTDAEREALAAAALRAGGFDAARPVVVGSRGRASFYLCAEVVGRTLGEHVARGEGGRTLLDAAARFCGRTFAAGFSLPDLSPDHVFVLGERPHRFALIDLHNATARRRPDARAARRALRRSLRQLRGSPLARHAALRTAVRFLREAGLGERARRILERLPPFDTHGRYDVAGRSRAYHARDPRRALAERRLVSRVWPALPGATVLDAPCGAGRMREHLGAAHRAVWHGADRSRAMLDAARSSDADAGTPLVLADAAALPFDDRAFDAVLCFRFLHHLPHERARDVVREAARVADRFVVLSFFHPLSTHHALRRARELLRRSAPTRHALWTRTVIAWMRDEGFDVRRVVAQPPALRDLRVAAFERRR